MIPGPYSICHVTFEDDSDGATYRTLRYGYDTTTEAHAALESVANESGVDDAECAVIRHFDIEESNTAA